MAASDLPRERTPGDESGTPPPAPLPAWELVEAGRYRPRRTRGSFPGRELG